MTCRGPATAQARRSDATSYFRERQGRRRGSLLRSCCSSSRTLQVAPDARRPKSDCARRSPAPPVNYAVVHLIVKIEASSEPIRTACDPSAYCALRRAPSSPLRTHRSRRPGSWCL